MSNLAIIDSFIDQGICILRDLRDSGNFNTKAIEDQLFYLADKQKDMVFVGQLTI